MNTDTLEKHELYAAYDEAVNKLTSLSEPLTGEQFNTVPYENSWTPAQLLRHIILSTNGIAKTISKPFQPAERDAAERIPGLKEIFLNFSKTFNAPDFIVPEAGPFEKEKTIGELKQSFEQLKHNADEMNPTELVEGLPFGPSTKLEIMHFVVYHTQRHVQQMERICAALQTI